MVQINDISDLLDLPLYYQGCEPASDSTEASPPPSTPPPSPPNSPLLGSSSSTTNPRSPALTEEEEVHYDNVIFLRVDSPVLPSQPPTPTTETSMTLAYSPARFVMSTTITNVPSPSAISANSSPRMSSASISPPVFKRRRSSTVESTESEPGPSTSNTSTSGPRPAKRARISIPEESTFQLDVQVPAFMSSTPSGPPTEEFASSTCKYRNRTSKPARHSKTACPYNNNQSCNRVSCELCEMTISRHDNIDRHMADYH